MQTLSQPYKTKSLSFLPGYSSDFTLAIWCAAKKGWELSTTATQSGNAVLRLLEAVIVLTASWESSRALGIVQVAPRVLHFHQTSLLPSQCRGTAGQPLHRLWSAFQPWHTGWEPVLTDPSAD